MSWFLRDFMDDPVFFGRVFDPISVGTAAGASLLTAGATAGASALLTKKPPTPPITPIPDLNDPASLAARKKQQEEIMARAGRQSTILADDRVAPDTSYKGTVLGS